jgi:RHS repeat-associated protein
MPISQSVPRIRFFGAAIMVAAVLSSLLVVAPTKVLAKALASLAPPAAQHTAQMASTSSSGKNSLVEKELASLPLAFEPNQGQAGAGVAYVAHGSGFTVLVRRDTLTLVIAPPPKSEQAKRTSKGATIVVPPKADPPTPSGRPDIITLTHSGANPDPVITGESPLPGKVNYLTSSDPSQWHIGLTTYSAVRVHDLYPGIDLVIHSNNGKLEFDYDLKPGAAPGLIHLHVSGDHGTALIHGLLSIATSFGHVTISAPSVTAGSGRVAHHVAAHFTYRSSDGLGIGGLATPSVETDVDPTVSVYSTYIGGSGSDAGAAIALDSAGDAYVASFAGSGFPTTSGAYQTTYSAGDLAVTEMNSSGTALIYSTYIGVGYPRGIAVDSSGDAYVVGSTSSSSFPTVGALYSCTSSEGFVTKLNSTGTSLTYSTCIPDTAITAIALDSTGDSFVAGDATTGFPATSGAYQTTVASGVANAYAAEINSSGSAFDYSTAIGGSGGEEAFGVAVNSSGDAVIAGSTNSTNYPTTSGAYQTSWGAPSGGHTGFVTTFNSSGSSLGFSTYLGGTSGHDHAWGVAEDSSGNIYVAGATVSTDFPTTTGAYQTANPSAGSIAFVTSFSSTGSVNYSTYYGGSPYGSEYSEAFAIAADTSGDAYITGTVGYSGLPLVNAPEPQYLAGGHGYDLTAFIATIAPGGGSLLYSTYLGGTGGDDAGFGIAVDANQEMYVTGQTNSTDFPTTSGAYQRSYGGGTWDSFVTKLPLDPIGGPLSVTQALQGSGNACFSCELAHLQAGDGEPVDTATGNFWHMFDDIEIDGRGLPLTVTRTYDSSNAAVNGPLGYGWNFNYQMNVAVTGTSPNEVATITQETGDLGTFCQPTSGSVWNPCNPTTGAALPRETATLTAVTGGGWVLVRHGQETDDFNSSGQLTSESDLNGYTTTLTYTSGELTSVSDQAGRSLAISWTGSHITSITDNNVSGNSRTVTYEYNDGNGNLTDVIDMNGGTTHMVYDSNHRMTVLEDPVCEATSGCPGVQNHYDSSGRVDWQKDQLNRETTFNYTAIPGATEITNPASNVAVDYYVFGLLVAETVGYGTSDAATTEYAYDPATLALTSTIDPNHNITSYTVDSNGNRLTQIDPLGRETTWTYNSFNETLTTTDPNGVTTTKAYNSDGDLSSMSTPLTNTTATATNCVSPITAVAMAAVTCFTYGDSSHPGDVTAIADPDGNTADYQYDTNGNVDEVKDPAGDVTATEYNADDWLLDSWTPRAGCTWGSAPPTGCSSTYESQYSYDAPGTSTINEFGLAGTVTDALGHTTGYTYDADGRTLTVTDGTGDTTTTAYDVAGELCWTLPGGTSSAGCSSPPTKAQVTTYNSDGTVYQQKDGKGNAISTYGYNHRGQITSTKDPLANTTTYALDADGNVITRLDPVSGATCSGTKVGCTTNTFNADNELTSVMYSDSPSDDVTSITYDSDGQQTGMTDGTGTSSWSYDSLHRLTGNTNGNGDTVSYGYTYGSGPTYDLRAQVRSITYPHSVGTVDQSWNADGQLTTVEDWNSKSISLQYGPDDNVTKITYPSTVNVIDTLGYNAADLMSSTSDKSGATTLFSATYQRTANEQVKSDTSQPTSQQTFKYTAQSQLCYAGSTNTTACTSPPTGAYAYAYDNGENLTNNKGVTQQYNAADELCWTVSGSSTNACASPPTGATTFGYDNKGNETSVVAASGSGTCYTYDQRNLLTEAQTGTGSTCTSPTTVASYSYDGDGQREAKTVSGTTTHFTWDGTGSLVLQQEAGTTITSYLYGPGGKPLEQITGSTATYLHHDQLGSIRLITDSAGSTSTATTVNYDPYGNTVSSSGSLTSHFGFAGQYLDAETGFLYLRARYYDPATGQFLTRDPAVAITLSPYGYVAGNPVNASDPSGLHVACGGVDNSGGGAGYSGTDSCAQDLPWTGPLPASDLNGSSAGSIAESAVAACAISSAAPGVDLDCGPLLAIAGLAGIIAFCSGVSGDASSGITFAKRPQPQTPEQEADAHSLADEGEAILGRGHNPANADAWNSWWGQLTRQEKAFYDWAGGPRPARQ